MESVDYEELFEYSPDAMIRLDIRGTVTAANQQASRFLGYARSEMIGNHALAVVAPEHRGASRKRLQELAEGRESGPVLRMFVRRDGSRVPGEIIARVVRGAGGEVQGIVSVIRDASETVTRERMRAEQASRLQALGTVASGVAHDFNNILASIVGFTELAREQLEPDSAVARDLDRTLKAAGQAKQLVSQILAFGRQPDDHHALFDVEQAIVQVIRLVRTTLPAGTELQFASDHSPSVVLGDQAKLQQVIMNLCANAGKAIGDRGGTVRIRLETVEAAAGPRVKVSVADDGPGVPSEIRDYIFEPFFSTRTGSSGTGLGLAMSKTIVESFGGSLQLDDTESGARFTVSLPAHDGQAVSPPEKAMESPEAAGGTVLVLDDEQEIVEIVTRILGQAGYSVMASTDPLDAVQLANTWAHELKLIVCDYNMPAMNGTEFLRRVREAGATAPAVILTAVGPRLTQSEQADLGVAEIVRKPVQAAALTHIVATAMDGAAWPR